jgi:hypothetical protein
VATGGVAWARPWEGAGTRLRFTALSYLLSAPSAKSTMEERPTVRIRSAATLPAMAPERPEWFR